MSQSVTVLCQPFNLPQYIISKIPRRVIDDASTLQGGRAFVPLFHYAAVRTAVQLEHVPIGLDPRDQRVLPLCEILDAFG